MAKKKPKARVPGTKPAAPVFPLPDVRGMESMLAAIGRGAAHYTSDEAMLRAQDLMYEAFDSRGARRAMLALEALAISPDCADAYLLLAEETASSMEEARELLEQGVAAGERALGPAPFEENVGHFWGLIETRPYMRARRTRGDALGARPARGGGRAPARAAATEPERQPGRSLPPGGVVALARALRGAGRALRGL